MKITAENTTRTEDAVTLTLSPQQAAQLWQVLNAVENDHRFFTNAVRENKYGYGETVKRTKNAISSTVAVWFDVVNYEKETTE